MLVILIVWIAFIRLEKKKTNKVESHKNSMWNKDLWGALMPPKDTKKLFVIRHHLLLMQMFNKNGLI